MKKLLFSISFLFLFFSLFGSFPFAQAVLININTAGVEELDNITGVGPAIAGKIIDYRNANGLFKTIEEIKNVSGIGDITFSKMKDEITVGSSSATPDPSSSSSANVQISNSVESSGSGGYTANTNQSEISNYKKEDFKIGAGKERLATVRTPILFSASQNKKGKDENYFTWSFGDGTVAYGVKVYHSYQFPGNYNVVLNGRIDNDEEATARTAVLVVDSKIKVTAVDANLGFVEITNNSDKEQNLNGWKLNLDNKVYSLPIDTIISPKAVIKIPLKFLGFDLNGIKKITLAYPDGGIASGASLQTNDNRQKISEISKKLGLLKKELANQEIKSKNVSIISGENKKLVNKQENVITLKKEGNLIDKIKNAIF